MTDDLPTKALSVRQPWAWLIVNGWKDIENRDWKPSNPGLRFRGSVLIHASRWWKDEEAAADWADACAMAMKARGEAPPISAFADAAEQRGGIVGVASIIDTVRQSDSPWFTGPYGFKLVRQRALPLRRCDGQLGFFTVAASRV